MEIKHSLVVDLAEWLCYSMKGVDSIDHLSTSRLSLSVDNLEYEQTHTVYVMWPSPSTIYVSE